MVYVDYNEKDDMQDDIYKLVGLLLKDCVFAGLAKDAYGLLDSLDWAFRTLHSRMKEKSCKDIRSALDHAKVALYPEDGVVEDIILSGVFDDLADVYSDMTAALNSVGILMKMKINLDELIKEGGR